MNLSGNISREVQGSDLGSDVGISMGFGVDADMADGNDSSGSVGIDLDVVGVVDVELQGESMQVDQDLGKMTLDLPIRSQNGSEVHSASTPSLTDGLPQGPPQYQRHSYDDVDALI